MSTDRERSFCCAFSTFFCTKYFAAHSRAYSLFPFVVVLLDRFNETAGETFGVMLRLTTTFVLAALVVVVILSGVDGATTRFTCNPYSITTASTYRDCSFTLPAGSFLLEISTGCGMRGAYAAGDTYLQLRSPGMSLAALSIDNDDACDSRASYISYTASLAGTWTVRQRCFSSLLCSGTTAIAITTNGNALTSITSCSACVSLNSVYLTAGWCSNGWDYGSCVPAYSLGSSFGYLIAPSGAACNGTCAFATSPSQCPPAAGSCSERSCSDCTQFADCGYQTSSLSCEYGFGAGPNATRDTTYRASSTCLQRPTSADSSVSAVIDSGWRYGTAVCPVTACSLNTDCESCLVASKFLSVGCGWCASAGRCIAHNTAAATCAYGYSTTSTNGGLMAPSQCPSSDVCKNIKNCLSCLNAVQCGWCGDGSTAYGGVCQSGTAFGPTAPNTCDAANWNVRTNSTACAYSPYVFDGSGGGAAPSDGASTTLIVVGVVLGGATLLSCFALYKRMSKSRVQGVPAAQNGRGGAGAHGNAPAGGGCAAGPVEIEMPAVHLSHWLNQLPNDAASGRNHPRPPTPPAAETHHRNAPVPDADGAPPPPAAGDQKDAPVVAAVGVEPYFPPGLNRDGRPAIVVSVPVRPSGEADHPFGVVEASEHPTITVAVSVSVPVAEAPNAVPIRPPPPAPAPAPAVVAPLDPSIPVLRPIEPQPVSSPPVSLPDRICPACHLRNDAGYMYCARCATAF